MRAAVARNLPEKTGRSLEEWVEVVRAGPGGSRKERVEWLKREHGLGHVQAGTVVEAADRAPGERSPTAEELIDAQYDGKSELRRVFERLRAEIEAVGDDVEVEPRKTYVAFSRGRQFALAQPSTRDRLDVGLALAEAGNGDRLRPADSFGSERITHRVAVRSPDEVDAELVAWLRRAYEDVGG